MLKTFTHSSGTYIRVTWEADTMLCQKAKHSLPAPQDLWQMLAWAQLRCLLPM